MLKKILNIVTVDNFVKYVLIQFGLFHIFYSALNGGEGNIGDIKSWIPFMLLCVMVVVVAMCEFIRKRID